MRKLSGFLAVLLTLAAAAWYGLVRFPPLKRVADILPGTTRDTPVSRTVADSDTAWALPPRGPAVCGPHCGTERWAIKTLSDGDRDLVHLRPVDASIEDLVALPRPPHVAAAGRMEPAELTVYRITVRVRRLIEEDDHDWHLVLESPRDSAITMIAEIPDPACAGACSSGFAERFTVVRNVLFGRLNAPGGEKKPLLSITGVGFFDYLHGQTGAAPNGLELHPVLAVEFP
jgi:hypothetical protein